MLVNFIYWLIFYLSQICKDKHQQQFLVPAFELLKVRDTNIMDLHFHFTKIENI